MSDIFNTLLTCKNTNTDFYIIFNNFNFKYKYSPIFSYNLNPNTNLPITLSIYDEGWDEIDDVLFNNIKECIPILKSNI
tara:strand:+ start:11 stop:247 length:237 start_codon:yes stop_codon:yes gene_type:complete